MAHKYHGTNWRYYYLDAEDAASNAQLPPMGTLHFTDVADDGVIRAGRDNQGRTFTGRASIDGKVIEFVRDDGVRFFGSLIFEGRMGANLVTVLAGEKGPITRRAVSPDEQDDGSSRKDMRLDGQEDGMWIATKP